MQDSNLRPLAPKASAIPDYANSHFVIGPGLEPKLNVPKTFVLPLHHPTIWAGDWVRTSNFVLGRNALCQLSYTRFCAFWELRYPGPIINSDVLYLWAKKAYIQKKPLNFQSEVSQYYSKIITFYPTSVSSNCTKLPPQFWLGWLQSVCVRVLIVNIYLIILF